MNSSIEWQKMLSGEPYASSDPGLVAARSRARRLTKQFNATSPDEAARRDKLLRQLLGSAGNQIWIEPPFFCDYGSNIYLGENAYLNFGCVFLDCHEIRIGRNVLIGPNVQIYAAYHPVEAALRLKGLELAAPVSIGDNVWIGGGAIICPGVIIGSNTTIGAGSVVVNNIPENVVAVGNPCRVIRRLEPASKFFCEIF